MNTHRVKIIYWRYLDNLSLMVFVMTEGPCLIYLLRGSVNPELGKDLYVFH